MIVPRMTLTIILVAIALFCGFGFLASGEAKPATANGFRMLYGTAPGVRMRRRHRGRLARETEVEMKRGKAQPRHPHPHLHQGPRA